ncbi:MAG TPA: pyrimidine 5'-nucleotidase [Mariprofundaceae bacterium]|nr:pyrimidine 5'-nucleotidase [Mariprofundaceae bacterium]
MPFDLAVIDLDNTLYRASSGVFARMDARMNRFIEKNLSVDTAEANRLRRIYWGRYGTTLRGLMLHHGIDPEAFLDEVHDIGVDTLLAADRELDAALAAMPGRKIIHTNGTREHAERVLAALDIRRHFHAIYDIRFNAYRPKPCHETLAMLLAAEKTPPARAIVIDDMADNLAAAMRLGAHTAWISDGESSQWHFCSATVAELARRLSAVLPQQA